MKPKHGSHGEPAAAHQQDENEIVRMEPEEIQPAQDAGPLPGLSVAQTEFFYAVQKRYAKHGLALTIDPDGEMCAFEIGGSHDGEAHASGSIHDPRNVFNLIPTMYDATLNREEVTSLMFKLFPGSMEVSFLLESGGGK
jgi:hypothetical protein